MVSQDSTCHSYVEGSIDKHVEIDDVSEPRVATSKRKIKYYLFRLIPLNFFVDRVSHPRTVKFRYIGPSAAPLIEVIWINVGLIEIVEAKQSRLRQ